MTAENKPKLQFEQMLRFSKLAAMSGGFLTLLLEVRFQHRAVAIDDWRPWLPIVFCNFMIYFIPVAGVYWHQRGKQWLIGAYSLTMLLGLIGVYFHSEGHMVERLMEVVNIWMMPLKAGAEIAAHYPPVLAPLAFVGLGAIGLIFCFDSPMILSEDRVRHSQPAPPQLSVKS